MNKIKVCDRQTLIDIALATCGQVESAMAIALACGRSLTAEVCDGEELPVNATELNAVVVKRYKADGIVPATELTDVEKASFAYEGIGVDAIEVDFTIK